MSKKSVQPQDKYVLRLPDGMRDRIKAYAEKHGRTMNAEIVRILEQHFPEPEPLQSRIERLWEMVRSLQTEASEQHVDQLSEAVKDTIERIVKGSIPGLSPDARKQLSERLLAWEIEDGENAYLRFTDGMTEEEIEALGGASDMRRW